MSDNNREKIHRLCDFIEDDEKVVANLLKEPLEDVHVFLSEHHIDSRNLTPDMRTEIELESDTEAGHLLKLLKKLLIQFKTKPAFSLALGVVVIMIALQSMYPRSAPVMRERSASPIDPYAFVETKDRELESLHVHIADLFAQGKYEQAEGLVRQVLDLVEESQGPDHPDTAHALNNLAVLQKKLGKHKQAGIYYNRALTIQERKLGKDHPSTLTTLNNLGRLYEDTKRYEKAENIYKYIFETNKDKHGVHHDATIESRNSLMDFYKKFGHSF